MSAMDKDTDMKNMAREMMKMTSTANKTLKAKGFKQEVTCNTCHLGAQKPKK